MQLKKKYPFDFLIPRGFEALRHFHFEKLLPRFWSCKQRGGGEGTCTPISNFPNYFLPASIVCAIQFLRELLNAFSRIFPKSSAGWGLKPLSHFFWRDFLAKKSKLIKFLYWMKQTCLRKSCYSDKVLQLSKSVTFYANQIFKIPILKKLFFYLFQNRDFENLVCIKYYTFWKL